VEAAAPCRHRSSARAHLWNQRAIMRSSLASCLSLAAVRQQVGKEWHHAMMGRARMSGVSLCGWIGGSQAEGLEQALWGAGGPSSTMLRQLPS